MRRWLACGLVGFWWLGLFVTACGDDQPAAGPGTPDGAAPVDGSGPTNGDSSIPALAIVASDLTIYTGVTATVDASQTAATTFAWTVKSTPPGSVVTTATLQGATTARPSFLADLSGDYSLEVTATGGGTTGTKTVKVTAVAAPIFFMQTNFNEDPAYFEYRAIGNDKSNNRPIACRIPGSPKDAGDTANQEFISLSEIFADTGLDWWEAAPGSASRVAFGTFVPLPDAGSDFYLSLGSSDTTCQSPPAAVHRVVEDGGAAASELSILQPRFSPDGARVAYVESRVAGYTVESVSHDGLDRRDIAQFCLSNSTANCWQPAFFPPRPQWFDIQTLGWANSNLADGGVGWQIILASDSANPQPHVYMTCPGSVPRSIAFLKDGSVVANPSTASTAIEDLAIFKPATPGGTCQLVRNLTNFTHDGSYARDFSISPDETEIAFVRTETPADSGVPTGGGSRYGGYVYVAPLNGSAPPVPLGSSPSYALFGPRYVASASQLSWNGVVPYGPDADTSNAVVEAGVPSINVAARSGGATVNLVTSDLDAGVYVIGGGNGGSCDFRLCSFGVGGSSGGGAIATAFAAIGLALRRRRRA